MQETLKQITETVDGYEIKDLRWLPIDNIFVGLVKCPVWGNESLHNGFISCSWTRRGKPTPKMNYHGKRPDLHLKMPL